MAGRPPRRRVLLVTNSVSWAGAETQLNYLAAGLSEAGHSVRMLAIEDVSVSVERLRNTGVAVTALEASTRADKLRSVVHIARQARWADVVHCTGWDATLWGRLGALLARRPTVITEHTPGRALQVTDRNEPRAREIALHNRFLDRVTYATVAVANWQQALLAAEGVRPESIVHIPNAVPVAELRHKAEQGPSRASLGFSDECRVILHLARFAAQKGQPRTLRAAARLRDRLGDLRVLFVGDGPTEETVRREAASLGADWALFLGRRDDVPGLLGLADLSVLPSSGEGLPMSLIEAVVLGTPVVATDVGDIRWLLEGSKAGIPVPVDDEEAFAQACERVLSDRALAEELAAAGRESAPRFDAARMVRSYERVFEAAIESAPLPLALPDD